MAKETKLDKVKELEKITQELFKLLEVNPKVEISEDEESIKVDVQGENLGLLIGQNGENLDSLQLILSLILNKKTGEWKPLSVDIGDWKKEKEEGLKRMIEGHINSLLEQNSETSLPPMSASQRRLAHVIIGQYSGLTSQSVGEEPNRYIIIRKD